MLWGLAGTFSPATLAASTGLGHWVAAVNAVAGTGRAQPVADQLAERLGTDLTVYRTPPDREQRVSELAALISGKRPSASHPLGVLVLGGDGTINDALTAIMRHIFPETRELLGRRAGSLADQMASSGIRLGTVQLGGKNDLSTVYGAPTGAIEDILTFLTESRLMALNMGLACLVGTEQTTFFSQTVSAGTTIADIFEKTRDERGRRAEHHQERLGLVNILRLRPFRMRWPTAWGQVREASIAEVLCHATVRAAGRHGFPGTPQPGLGIKIFPAVGLIQRLGIIGELIRNGRAVAKADPTRFMPHQRLTRLDASLQLSLEPGEGIEFSFWARDGVASEPPVQVNGDFIGRARGLQIHALPAFPNFMGQEGSLMAHLEQRLRPA